MKWRTDQEERAKRKLCKLNFTSSAKLKNLLFWSPGLRVSLLTSSRPICEPTSQDRIPALNSHVALGANSQNAVTILTKTTPRNSTDPILNARQVGPDAPRRHKMEQEIGRTPRKQPGKSINHYSQYKWSIQIDNKSVNGQHTRSLECIRRRGEISQPSRGKVWLQTVIYICTASLIQQTVLFRELIKWTVYEELKREETKVWSTVAPWRWKPFFPNRGGTPTLGVPS